MAVYAKPYADAFSYFRAVWDEEASHHLAAARFEQDWRLRFASVLWLVAERVPLSGAAPSLDFKGLPR